MKRRSLMYLLLLVVVVAIAASVLSRVIENERLTSLRVAQTDFFVCNLANHMPYDRSLLLKSDEWRVAHAVSMNGEQLREQQKVPPWVAGENGRVLDWWKNPIRMMWLDDGPALVSYGPNGKNDEGAVDDIVAYIHVAR